MTPLSIKTALVTGASRGIGRATALALADAGAHVVVHYARGEAEAQALVQAGRNFVLGGQTLKRIGQPADVADVIAFLASDAARWVTGDIIQAGGGSRL